MVICGVFAGGRFATESPNPMRKVLVTGSAGFIGYHLSQLLLDEGFAVVGYDGMTDYYDVRLKERRHQMLPRRAGGRALQP